ncbi:serine/threonine-protein kinase pelle-like [Prorops nasuta]|uniref:serine/threonine-protein kinase pelle-like n=1 Tax=Prorops nasuta TaxID=863751 RepID=UPI0034CE7D4B
MALFTSNEEIKYIYELPYSPRVQFCTIMNQHNKWEELAGQWMQYDFQTIQSLKREKDPSDELLTMWGHYNHTILELFVLLSRMKHYQAMMPLKPFVEEKYHKLIFEGEGNLQKILTHWQNKTPKELKIGAQNFNENIPLSPGAHKVKIIKNEATKEESLKILNNHLLQVKQPQTSNSNNLSVVTPVQGFFSPIALNTNNTNSITPKKPEATLPHIPFSELTLATNEWSKHNVLGRGGFGTVYKGLWKNTDVAVKRIDRRGFESDESYIIQLQQSLKEIKILNSIPHDNILSLYAYSLRGDAPCLVYQLMHNGSLADRLLLKRKLTPLNWAQRHEIAKGTARGLQYLHTVGDKPLIHGDIKSANILLDKNFEPRIGDFGLAREGPQMDCTKQVSKIHGTRPYLPDEFLRGKILSTKVDTYSYGIVLYELATGLAAYDDTRPENKYLKDFIDSWSDKDLPLLVDKNAGEQNLQVYSNLIVLGKWCANKSVKNRPEMELVYRKINDL